MNPRPLFLVVLILGALLSMPVASAAPTILPTSSSAYAVQATDYLEVSPVSLQGVLATTYFSSGTLTLTAPDGSKLEIVGNGGELAQGSMERIYLDGTHATGNLGAYQIQGNLVGVPGDGTWLIERPGTNSQNSLRVNTKGIDYTGFSGSVGSYPDQLWNYRSTTGVWVEPTHPIGTVDSPSEGPEEDPNNAVFFQDAGSEYTAYTLHATVSCGASAALHTMTVNGAWIGASGATNSFWASRDGQFLGTPDLRAIAGTTTTAPEAEGSTGSGTDTESVSYNNVAGSSYQFFVSTSAQGEALGVVAFAAPGQCTPTAPAGLITQSNQVVLSVSQAQCRNDPVSFAIDVDLTVAIALNDIDLAIYSATDGSLVANYDDGTMFTTNANQVLWMSDVFAPGPYMAEAIADVGGVGAVDLFDSAAFNIPEGTCIWQEPDLSGIYLALSLLEGNLTEIINTLDLVFDCSANCTINANLTLLQQILHNTEITNTNLTEHRNGTLEINNMSFNEMGFDGFLFFLLWIAAWFFAAMNRYYWLMAIATVGIVESILPDVLPMTWQEWSIMFLIVLLLQFYAEGRRKGLGSKDLGAFE